MVNLTTNPDRFCIKCEKPIELLEQGGPDQVENAGNIQLSFYFGSRHDMGIDMTGGEPYRSYLCDDCFDLIKHRFAN